MIAGWWCYLLRKSQGRGIFAGRKCEAVRCSTRRTWSLCQRTTTTIGYIVHQQCNLRSPVVRNGFSVGNGWCCTLLASNLSKYHYYSMKNSSGGGIMRVRKSVRARCIVTASCRKCNSHLYYISQAGERKIIRCYKDGSEMKPMFHQKEKREARWDKLIVSLVTPSSHSSCCHSTKAQ